LAASCWLQAASFVHVEPIVIIVLKKNDLTANTPGRGEEYRCSLPSIPRLAVKQKSVIA
jgi:hypothetical protein